MGKLALFLLKVIVPLYFIGTTLLFIITLVDYSLGLWGGNYVSRRHELNFGQRVFTVLAWPFLIFTVKGRKMLRKSWHNIVL